MPALARENQSLCQRASTAGAVPSVENQNSKHMNKVTQSTIASIVLVHGAFVDGSGWEAVYHLLRKEGHKVSIVQHPTISLSDDVAATKRIIAKQDGPVILVGH